MPCGSPISFGDCVADVTPVGCPPAVLVHRKSDAALVGQFDESLAELKVDDERLLTEDVLARLECVLENWCAVGRVRKNVDDGDIVALEYLVIVGGDVGVGVERLAVLLGALAGSVAQHANVVAASRYAVRCCSAMPPVPMSAIGGESSMGVGLYGRSGGAISSRSAISAMP